MSRSSRHLPPLPLLLVLAISGVVAQTDNRKVNAGSSKTNKGISFAPEAKLINGIDDIDPTGNCLLEITKHCNGTSPGDGALADCLSEAITESESVGSDVSVSDACREDVYQFKILRNTNINLNVPLAKACKVDAEKNCNVTWFFGYKSGQVISCLRDIRDRLAPACQKLVFKVQQDGAEDFRADADLYNACKDDSEKLCADVRNGGGRVQDCLREKRMQLSWPCEEQLYRQEIENADDIRLSVRLFVNCLPDKRKFCRDVEPGNANVKDCLEEHRLDKGFSNACKQEINSMIERRAADFRLDSRLRKSCEEDIYSMCSFIGDLDTMGSEDSSIVRCLQDYMDEMSSESCKKQVLKYQELAAEDIRFDAPLASACSEDRRSFCSSVPPGSAQVIRCLRKQRDKLSSSCRATLFDEEVRFSHNIDFQYPMKKACEAEINEYCAGVPHGDARVIRCLQDNQYMKDFSKGCKEEVSEYEKEAGTDYRLNFRLSKECKSDIDANCKGACNADQGEMCGGTVLRCLTEKLDELKEDGCKKEVMYFQKMEVNNYNNDVILAAACHPDVLKFCADVEPGEGAVHECLRTHRKELSEACRREELLLEEQEAENIELRPGLLRTCKQERRMFCKGVSAGEARVFRCLAENMGDKDFGEPCHIEISTKLQRRQANWKLDPALRKACKDSVSTMCHDEDSANTETGAVYKCLITQYDDLDSSCQKELGRAVHMAFFAWQANGIITSDCDDDIEKMCLSRRPNMAQQPGAVGQCLSDIMDEMVARSSKLGPKQKAALAKKPPAALPGGGLRTLSDKCHEIASVAEPPDMKKAFDASMSLIVLKNQLDTIEGTTGMKMVNRDPRSGKVESVTLTGWTALLGVAAMVVLVAWGGYQGYKRFSGQDGRGQYTLVVKQKPSRS